ncbi:MAG TPA: hypothetical protein VN317_09730 [Candidatus Methanoperedens sp.]|nr:hypothetical protein [Candidatus Methanoperedens sp.]
MKARSVRFLSLPVAAWLLAALCWNLAAAQEQAPGDWRVEFEAVCVKTDLALSLSSEELADLVARCDRLEERIGMEAEIVRRIYLKRLRSCRALFAYVLETRGVAPAGAPGTAAPAPAPPAAEAPAADAPAPVPSPASPALEQRPSPSLQTPFSPFPEGGMRVSRAFRNEGVCYNAPRHGPGPAANDRPRLRPPPRDAA